MSNYKIELKVMLDVTMPAHRNEAGFDETHWTMEVGSLGGCEVPAAAIAAGEPVDIDGFWPEEIVERAISAMQTGVGIVSSVESEGMTIKDLAKRAEADGAPLRLYEDPVLAEFLPPSLKH